MTHHIIAMPSRLELEPVIRVTQAIAAAPPDCAALFFDFQAWGDPYAWVTPFGMLAISSAVRALRARIPGIQQVMAIHPPQSSDAFSYAGHMGFFTACDMAIGKEPGQAKGSQRYLPLTKYDCQSIKGGRDAEAMGQRLAGLLLTGLTLSDDEINDLTATLAYSLREIIRNVIEHSRSADFWLCAQYAGDTAEIALSDSGIGLHTSLSANPHLTALLTDDRMALKYALMPGVSGKRWGKSQDDDHEYANSGYGLYMLYRLCNEGGDFYIASGKDGLYRQGEEDNRFYANHLPGVMLRLRMKRDAMETFGWGMQARFSHEAIPIAQEIEGGILPTGDRMSQMLRTGFRPNSEDGS